MPKANENLEHAVRRLGQAEISRRIGVPKITVHFWLRRGIPRAREEELRAAVRASTEDIVEALGGTVVYNGDDNTDRRT